MNKCLEHKDGINIESCFLFLIAITDFLVQWLYIRVGLLYTCNDANVAHVMGVFGVCKYMYI